jgi:SseB protein N-terminal domain
VQVSKPAGDTGEADNRVTEALGAYARGTGSEHAALTALAGARLLVPVVAIAVGPGGPGGYGGTGSPSIGGFGGALPPGQAEHSEMAIPTLVRSDGRRAVIAFTGTESLRRWKDDARPVPVPATRVWAAALAEADAAVIDVAGPVPLAVEGARLRALANGEPPPLPHEDPDIRAEVAAVTPDFTLGPGGPDSDLTVTLKTADMDQARQIALRLAPRCRRGIEIRTFLPERPRLTPAVPPLTPRSRPPRRQCRLLNTAAAPGPARRVPVHRSGDGARRSHAGVRDNDRRAPGRTGSLASRFLS